MTVSERVKIVVPGDDPAQIAGSPNLERLTPYGDVTIHQTRPGDGAEKIARFRFFQDDEGRMNLSSLDLGREFLVVSQFTLAADTQKGMRASFTSAAPPDMGREYFDRFVAECRSRLDKVETGVFVSIIQLQGQQRAVLHGRLRLREGRPDLISRRVESVPISVQGRPDRVFDSSSRARDGGPRSTDRGLLIRFLQYKHHLTRKNQP